MAVAAPAAAPVSRFASGETLRKDFPGDSGDYLVLKAGLTYGEALALSQAGMPQEGGALDLGAYYCARALAYIVEWGGPGFADRPVSRAAIEALTPENGGEIQRLLDAHVAERDLGKASPAPENDGGLPLP